MKLYLTCVLAGALLLAGCSSSSGPAAKTAQEYVNEGWQAYAAKNYSSALSSFTQALQLDGAMVDAHNGAGWSNGKLNNMTAAATQFDAGLAGDTTNLQIKAGLAFVLSAQKDYASSILRARQVLQADSNWVFGRDLSVSAADLHLLLAADYFATADFQSSLTELQKIEPTFVVNVSTVIGRLALADEIERLRALV